MTAVLVIPGQPGAALAPRATMAMLERAAAWARRAAPDRAVLLVGPDWRGPPNLSIPTRSYAGDRAAALIAAADAALAQHGPPLLVVAADFPALAPVHEHAARADLAAGCDLVIGPSTSGDWYLLGLRAPAPALLAAATGANAERHADRRERAGAALRAAFAERLALGMLRSERPLRSEADAAALRADPLAPAEIVAALGVAGPTIR